ncbi:MAG: sulfite exporter TauE/SafE family protein [Anaerolineales bacterium]|nr:sulfite exporter TauE/SafE family protein [Anaerolineales bacterium]
MDAIWLAFITGLTTGGLSCLAVQGGLLAGSLGQQLEKDLGRAAPPTRLSQRLRARAGIVDPRAAPAAPRAAVPIALFLLAKLVLYTLLGGVLGWLGSFVTLDPLARAGLMMVIGVFLIGNGLRMFNVHPLFRYFNFEPPKFITRYIRRTAKGDPAWFTPLFLGALTVLIPCGVTQAMLATALGTGSAAQGAALMFAFTLGTSPVFFAVAYLTTKLGARLEKYFLRFVAIVLLVLGAYTLDSGLNLAGAPLSLSGLLNPAEAASAAAPAAPAAEAGQAAASGAVLLNATNGGYTPRLLRVKAGQAFTLTLITDNTQSCARAFEIPALRVSQLLPATGQTPIAIPAQPAGTVLRFTCSMGMYTGQIVFEN